MTKKKKDDSKPSDEFTNCRCCGEYIKGDNRSKEIIGQRVTKDIVMTAHKN
jgi:hypothetical protein